MATNRTNYWEQFKYETANEIGVQVPATGYWGEIPSAQCGAVGGNMVRKMIAFAQNAVYNGQALQNVPIRNQ